MNNKFKDRLFLRRCNDGDTYALDQWSVLSYWSEVVDAVNAVVSKYTVGHVDIVIVKHLVVDCSAEIYAQWQHIPSRFHDLKTQVRKYAISYATKYVHRGGSLKSTP